MQETDRRYPRNVDSRDIITRRATSVFSVFRLKLFFGCGVWFSFFVVVVVVCVRENKSS